MKIRVSKQELKECITEAVTRILKEDEWDDLFNQAMADPKAAAAAAADMGLAKPKKGTGKRGRPSKNAAVPEVNPEDMEDALYGGEDDEVENADEPDVDDSEDSNFNRANFEFGSLSTQELKDIDADPSTNVRTRRTVRTELTRRLRMLRDVKDGCDPEWGYRYDAETDTIEPTHTDLGLKNVGAFGGSALGTNDGMNFKWGGSVDN